MDEQKLTNLQRRAYYLGLHKGLSKVDAQDFSQDYVLVLLSKGWRQTPGQAFIDWMRVNGNRGKPSALRKKQGKPGALRCGTVTGVHNGERSGTVDNGAQGKIDLNSTDDEATPIEEGTDQTFKFLDSRFITEEVVASFEGKQRMILVLLSVWGMDRKEVGYVFGVSESRISQWLIDIKEKLMNMKLIALALVLGACTTPLRYDHIVTDAYRNVLERVPTEEETIVGNAHFNSCTDRCILKLESALVRSDEYRSKYSK